MFVECSFYEQNTVSPQELQLRFQEYLEHEAKYFLNPVKYFLHCISTRYNETVFWVKGTKHCSTMQALKRFCHHLAFGHF